MTETIAANTRRLRDKARLSGADLAELMQGYGVAWNRTTVAKLETGRRSSVSVTEWLALALALDVPPVLLIADPRQGSRTVPVAEGVNPDSWETLMWLVGSGTIDTGNSGRTFTDGAWLINAGWTIVEALMDLRRAPRSNDPQDLSGQVEAIHRLALDRMREALETIAAQGAPAPRLPERVLKRAVELDMELPGVGD